MFLQMSDVEMNTYDVLTLLFVPDLVAAHTS